MSKKILIILIALTAILIAGAYVYFTYFPKPTTPAFQFRTFPPTREIPPPTTLGEKPAAEKKRGELTLLVAEPMLAPTLTRDGQGIAYILRENGNVYRIGFDGKEKIRISNTTIVGIFDARWSPDKSKLFISYERSGAVRKLILDLAGTQPSSTPISSDTRSAIWSGDGRTFFELAEQAGAGVRLLAGSAVGQGARERLKIPLGDLNIVAAVAQSLFFQQSPSGIYRGPVFQLNQTTGLFREITSGFGITALPSTSGEKVLVSVTNDAGVLQPLRIITLKDGSVAAFQIFTLAEKCAWSNATIVFCGAPASIPQALLPDDYYKGGVAWSDQLLRLDLAANSVTAYEVSGFDIQDLITDPKGESVFFRDTKTDFLYRFSLPE